VQVEKVSFTTQWDKLHRPNMFGIAHRLPTTNSVFQHNNLK
jgi:hypothetical protein